METNNRTKDASYLLSGAEQRMIAACACPWTPTAFVKQCAMTGLLVTSVTDADKANRMVDLSLELSNGVYSFYEFHQIIILNVSSDRTFKGHILLYICACPYFFEVNGYG
jgi:hypothetical protein